MAWLTIFSVAYGLASSTASYGGLGRRLRGLTQLNQLKLQAIQINIDIITRVHQTEQLNTEIWK